MKNIVIFDIEATCWAESENKPREEREVTEIGAVRIDIESRKIVDQLCQFVRPIDNPILSNYCIELTSIKQSDVDAAPVFGEAMRTFGLWLLKEDRPIYIMSWGYFDKNQIRDESLKKIIKVML